MIHSEENVKKKKLEENRKEWRKKYYNEFFFFNFSQNCNVHLHAEVELLKKALTDKQAEINSLRSACYQESDRQGELEDVVLAWQDKFERLYESHKKVQKINQNLEDKLLKLVDRNSSERAQLTSDCATLNIRLNQANYNISSLQREIVSFKLLYN
jgi:chromosome segregation ATPase